MAANGSRTSGGGSAMPSEPRPLRFKRKKKIISSMILKRFAKNSWNRTLQRVLANKKKHDLQKVRCKLEAAQTKLLKKFESLKQISETRLIAAVENNELELLVKEDSKEKLADIIPPKPINKIVESVNDTVDGIVASLIDKLKLGQNSKDNPEHQAHLEGLFHKIEEQKNKDLAELLQFVSTATEKEEEEFVQMQKELEDNKEALRQFEMEIAELKNSHLKALESLERELEKKAEVMIEKQDVRLTQVNKSLETLEKENKKWKALVKRSEEDIRREGTELTMLKEEIQNADDEIEDFNKKLSEAESALIRDGKDNHDLLLKMKNPAVEIEETTIYIRSHREKYLQSEMEKFRKYKEEIEATKRDIQSKIDCLQEEKSCAEENNRALQARIELLDEENPLGREHQSEGAKLKQSIKEQEFEIEQERKLLSEVNANFSQLETHGEMCQNFLELYIEMEDSESLQMKEVFAKDDENKTMQPSIFEKYPNPFAILDNNQELSDHNVKINLLKQSEEHLRSLHKEREKELKELQHEFEALQSKLKDKKS